jgi:hypothetical protein
MSSVTVMLGIEAKESADYSRGAIDGQPQQLDRQPATGQR